MFLLKSYCLYGTGFVPPCFIFLCNTVLCINPIKQRVTLNCIICDPNMEVQIGFFLNIAFVIMFMTIQHFNKVK